ncbi:MAG: hypothetical protein RLZZ126_1017 [Pseudomonadota bacterium]|jgi:uncharacterized protein (DUF1501 family)
MTDSSRRHLLAALGGMACGAWAPGVWAQAAPAAAEATGGRLVVLFLRGAYDGASALVPWADRAYHAARPNIAIPAPDGSASTAIRLDDRFALHPALAPLAPLWRQGALAAVPQAGLPAPNRSHFDAQYLMELGQTTKSGTPHGWLNRLAARQAGPEAALAVGEANPAILAGPAGVRQIPRGQAAERTGMLANDRARAALQDLYAANPRLADAFRQGANSRMDSAATLSREMQAAQGGMDGPADARGLVLDAQHLGALMRTDPRLRIGFLSAGGWDTHANQGAVDGQLANNLASLAQGVVELRRQFSQPGDVIVVMSEFGRTAAENGTRGTDHGFGNVLWLLGDRVQGGRTHGLWTGFAPGDLNESRDMPAHHDYRAVIAQALRASFGLDGSALQDVLPGASWDTRLDGLLRRG